MILNEHVNLDTTTSEYTDIFTPDEGYALWRDDEVNNLDPETGEPFRYWLTMRIQKKISESWAPHIFAKLIDDTMEVFGKPNQQIGKLRSSEPVSHTYIDENGVERQKKGVY